MIKLIRPTKPELLAQNEAALTQQFLADKKLRVWSKPYIIKPLAEMSHNKCCFCETLLGEQAKNLNVEHYHYKEAYSNEVVKWDNLLPACGQCNSNKGTHDTYKEPLIDPTNDDPRDYLYIKFYRIMSKDCSKESKGRMTVDLLDLNNRERLITPRLKIAEILHDKLDYLIDKVMNIKSGKETRQLMKTRLKNGIRDVLKMAQPDAEYSAFISTILLEDDDYITIRKTMKVLSLWTEGLEELHFQSNNIKLEYR